METILTDSVKEFVRVHNWFDRKYLAKSDARYQTFKGALNLFYQRGGSTIVETGCARLENDWGGGLSTMLFADVTSKLGGHVWSVDISRQNLNMCQKIIQEWPDQVTLTESDSVVYLAKFDRPIDLLYLDSYDYPYGPILDAFGGKTDIHQALILAEQVPEPLLVERFKDLITPCQEHTVKELYAALPRLHDKSVILIDDNKLGGGGKSRLAREELHKLGWECILDYQQTLWIKR